VGDIEFWVIFVTENLTKLQKLILKGEISWEQFHTWANGTCYISLCIKEGCLFVCGVAISQNIMPPCPPIALLVLLKIPQWVGVHQDDLVLFRPMVQELLDIE
jgi:hypothetical protein